jgi:hypothetical protein
MGMTSAFISYRREDSSGWAGRLAAALRNSFGADQVFVDINTLEPGSDYTEAIEQRLASVDMLLAVIGPQWLSVHDKKGQRRLDDPKDLVRIEIAKALGRGIRVVPVLVGGATMPSVEDLPEDLQGLARRQAHELSDTRWEYDQEQLIKHIRRRNPTRVGFSTYTNNFMSYRKPILLIALLIILMIIVGIYSSILMPIRESGPAQTMADPSTAPLAAFAHRRLALISGGPLLESEVIHDLRAAGAEVRPFEPDQLQDVGIFRPDLVIVASDTGTEWGRVSPRTLRQLFSDERIVGLGSGGAELFQILDANIGRGSVMHFPGNFVLEVAAFPRGSVPRPTVPDVISVHEGVRADAIGVYDEGSPTIAGFEAIARWTNARNHWPVARQGNLLLWGFDAPLDSLTDDGRLLLNSLLTDHLQRPFVHYTDVQKRVADTRPGRIIDRLTRQFPGQQWPFRVDRTGTITAKLTWTPSAESLALILNGPGQIGYYARQDGRPPLRIDFEVTDELLARGNDWQISVAKHGELHGDAIEYTLELDYPK